MRIFVFRYIFFKIFFYIFLFLFIYFILSFVWRKFFIPCRTPLSEWLFKLFNIILGTSLQKYFKFIHLVLLLFFFVIFFLIRFLKWIWVIILFIFFTTILLSIPITWLVLIIIVSPFLSWFLAFCSTKARVCTFLLGGWIKLQIELKASSQLKVQDCDT